MRLLFSLPRPLSFLGFSKTSCRPQPPQIKKRGLGKMEPDVCGMGKKKGWEEEEVLGSRL